MSSVKVHWFLGFKQKQRLAGEVLQNIVYIQTYNWAKYAICESTLSGGLQAEAMASRRSSSKQFTHPNIQLNKVRALWKYRVLDFKQKQRLAGDVLQNLIHIQTYNWTKYAVCESTLSGGVQAEAMASRRSFSKHFTHPNIQLNKVCALWKYKWVVGFKRKQWLSEENFQNIIHIQTYNWTMYALCESIVSRGLQAEAIAFGRKFSKHYTHSNIQLKKVSAPWKYSDSWVSSRSNGFQKKFFKILCTFKHTIEQSICSVKVHWVVGFKQKQWFSDEFFKTLYTFKRTSEKSMRSVKVHWVVGFKQKQWLLEEVFQNIIHIQT